MTEETPKNQQFDEDHLFKLTMDKKWEELVKIYIKHPTAHTTKLNISEETALHIAVSSYHTKSPFNSEIIYIEQMVESIENNINSSRPLAIDVLSMQNVRGDTPLHLAAAVGCVAICKCIASRNHRLIAIRNANSETPLFVAAHHGHLKVFLCLQELYNEKRDEAAHDPETESLCRRNDGNTVLHSAISGEYFKLAYQIISYYPKLVNSINEDGESPLHVLAKMPNVFKSGSRLGFFESIIYYCVSVDHELKQQKYKPAWASQESTSEINVPENSRTCMNIWHLLWNPISKTISAICPCFKNEDGRSADEENQPTIKDAKGESKDDAFFPPNYTTCALLFKCAATVILTVLGIGFWDIRMIKEKKLIHSHAFGIMSKLIEFESRYKYRISKQRTFQELDIKDFGRFDIPSSPPHGADEHETYIEHMTISSAKVQSRNEINGEDHNKSVRRPPYLLFEDTPLLAATKFGIIEMVKKIIGTCPIAIQDLDSNGKNVSLLAVENRHVIVLDYLLEINLSEYMFHQLDYKGNSILHLAARLTKFQPWHIPGATLQMQWEIKWYEQVKRLVPQFSLAHRNSKGKTPEQIFTKKHETLVKEGNEWRIKASESCSVVAALIATVAFATSTAVPGGFDQATGHPIFKGYTAFDIFAINLLVALYLSITALVFFLAIIISREERDFHTNLPKKLLMGWTSLSASIAAMLLSFCAGHSFILREKLRVAFVPIYAFASVPVIFFAIVHLPLYFSLLLPANRREPWRSYMVFHQ